MVSYSFALILVLVGAACAAKLDRDEACTAGSDPCFEGLKCEGGKCVENPEASLCHKKLLRSHESSLLGRFVPKCTEEGHFAPQQCQGSVCGCVDPIGRRLSRYQSVPIHRASEQNCQCAYDLARGGHLISYAGIIILCDKLGNYESVQCVGSECFCVDKLGQKIVGGPTAHISKIKTLNC